MAAPMLAGSRMPGSTMRPARPRSTWDGALLPGEDHRPGGRWRSTGRWGSAGPPYSRGRRNWRSAAQEVGAGHRGGPFTGAAVHRHGPQQQGLGHGGAGPVLAQKGDLEGEQPKGGGHTLVQQVPRPAPGPGPSGARRALPRARERGLPLQGGLGLLPGDLSQAGVLEGLVQLAPQRPGGLPAAPHRPLGQNPGRQGELPHPPAQGPHRGTPRAWSRTSARP